MITSVVVTLEIVLAGLLCLLAIRILTLTLTRTQPLTFSREDVFSPMAFRSSDEPQGSPTSLQAARSPSSNTTDLITQLHILLSLQARDTRENGLTLASAPKVVKAYALAWFYGAACALTEPANRHSEELTDTTVHLVARKLGISEMAAQQMFAGWANCSVRLACFRNGLEGAEYWSENRFVPREYSLYSAITRYAFI
ncbi:hypothetical protein [Marinobacter caseinilyticus]|uniref:hypothetical protein n=1 Tax=Marinobacter caseinilyticus TaxID=2692195 RepID=UPI00140E0F23|nr:hypothetical protein [Marinobacter caseinilyticus]